MNNRHPIQSTPALPPSQNVPVVAKIEIGMLQNGKVVGNHSGIVSREQLNAMLHTYLQDVLREFTMRELQQQQSAVLAPPLGFDPSKVQ